MRSTNNINTSDLDAEAAEGNVFWVVYDMDTQETLMSMEFDSYKWKAITLSAGDNWGLSELEGTARFPSYAAAEEAAQDVAEALIQEYPGEEVNLEIHRVRLEMVEMIQDIDCEAGKVKRAGDPEDPEQSEDEGWDVVSDEEEEEDEGFEANRFSRPDEDRSDAARVFGSQPFDPRGDINRQRKALEKLVISNKKPKAKKSTKKGKGRS